MSTNKKDEQAPFFDMVTATVEDSQEQTNQNPVELKGLLKKVLSDSDEVLGNFATELKDSNISIARKMDKIQELQTVALSESIKAFDIDTLDERRLFASQGLLKIASTLQGTITHKHKLELMESVDFTNPKISKGLNFFLELFVKTLSDEGVDTFQITKVLEVLEIQLFEFETVLQELFSKVPLSEVANIQNPFINNVTNEEELEPQNIFKDTPIDAEVVKKKSLKQRVKKKKAKRAKKAQG